MLNARSSLVASKINLLRVLRKSGDTPTREIKLPPELPSPDMLQYDVYKFHRCLRVNEN